MSKVDTQGWKAFRVGDLFEVTGSVTTPKQNLCLDDNADYPYVTTQAVDNGVFGYSNVYTEQGGVLTVDSAVAGSCFYQKQCFTASDHVEKLIPRFALTENCGLFLSAVMNKLAKYYGYSYAVKRSQRVLREEMIYLPATPDGQPDWVYMDAYMSEVLKKEEVFAEHLASLTAEAVADGHVLDTSGWKAFHLYDIFDIDMGNKFDRGKMPVGDAVNFVGRTGSNNGVNAVCGLVDGVAPYDAGALTLALGGTIGACFVQTDKFYTSQNVVVLFPKQPVSLMAKCFMSKVIWHVSDMYYDAFSNELNKHIKTDFVFYLPITSDGQPDWAWMEQYMQQQMDKAEALVEHLDAVWG